jgi:acetyltransferase-like isoleucine patch superfamily enzyme
MKLYAQKWWWYERNSRPLRRARMHLHAARMGAFIRFPVEGNVLESLDSGQLRLGEGTLLEPGCWITIAEGARVVVGEGCFLNKNTMIAAQEEVTIGDHVMFANGCFISDAAHGYDRDDIPVTWQGFTSKGPTRIGSNCWFGVNCVVNTGVTIGDRCVIGANSVVTKDIPPGVIAAGAPAKVIREIEFRQEED